MGEKRVSPALFCFERGMCRRLKRNVLQRAPLLNRGRRMRRYSCG